MDDGVAAGEDGAAAVVEPESVDAHVAGESADPPGCHVLVGLGCARPCQLVSEPVEGVVAQHVAPHALGRAAPPRADHQHQFAVGHATQQAFGESRPQEPGGASDGDALTG